MKSHTAPEEPKGMNENIRSVCLSCFYTFTEQGFLEPKYSIVYDILARFDFISLTGKDKKEYYRKAQAFLIRKKMEDGAKEYSLSIYKTNKSLTVTFQAKVFILEDFFAKLDAEGKTLNQIL